MVNKEWPVLHCYTEVRVLGGNVVGAYVDAQEVHSIYRDGRRHAAGTEHCDDLDFVLPWHSKVPGQDSMPPQVRGVLTLTLLDREKDAYWWE